MAVTPVGNPYVESSDLVANYPGVSETLAERIDVVGVNPFADSAARATAIPSPVEGQMASLNNDDKVYRYNGSAWLAVGTGLNHIVTNDFTSVSSVAIDTVFTSAPSVYLLVINSQGTITGTTYMQYRMRTAGTPLSSAGAYTFSGILNSNSAGPTRDYQSQTYGVLGNVGNISGQFVVWIVVPASSNYPTIFSQMHGEGSSAAFVGSYNSRVTTAGSYDGIEFYPGSGTITGTYRLYSLQNS
jgi:hypothetical protein